MDFDYYFKKYDEECGFNDSELCGFEIGFGAGQQSKQEEVNKLQLQIDELQNRIDDALDHTVNHGGYDDLTHIINILKVE